MSYATVVLADTPKVFLELQDASLSAGGNAADSSANAYPECVITGTIAAHQTGPTAIPYAGDFTAGADIQIRTTGPTNIVCAIDSAAYTLEAWIKTSETSFSFDRTIIGENQQGSPYNYIRLSLDASTKKLSFERNGADGAQTVVQTSGTALNDGAWHHVAVTISGDTTCILYVDGAAVTTTGSLSGALTTTGTRCLVGCLKDVFGGTGRHWSGLMSGAAITRSALSAARILAHYNAGLTAPPTNTGAPAVTGATTNGSVLTSTTGTWTGSPSSYSYQWKKNGSNVGSDQNTYTISGSPGDTITCTVTATNAGGGTAQISNTVTVTAAATAGKSGNAAQIAQILLNNARRR